MAHNMRTVMSPGRYGWSVALRLRDAAWGTHDLHHHNLPQRFAHTVWQWAVRRDPAISMPPVGALTGNLVLYSFMGTFLVLTVGRVASVLLPLSSVRVSSPANRYGQSLYLPTAGKPGGYGTHPGH